MLSNCCHLKQYTNSGTDEMFISFINNNNNNLDLYRSSKDEWKKKRLFTLDSRKCRMCWSMVILTLHGGVLFVFLFVLCVCVWGGGTNRLGYFIHSFLFILSFKKNSLNYPGGWTRKRTIYIYTDCTELSWSLKFMCIT